MTRGSSLTDRRVRIQKLETLIKEKGIENIEKLLKEFAYAEGISLRCAREYYSVLKGAGVVS